MPLPYNPNTIGYGSKVLPITRASTLLIDPGMVCENVTVDRPSKSIDRMDELGAPNGFVLVEAPITGSATAQYTANKTPIPSDLFTYEFDSVIGSEDWVITQVGTPFAQMDYFKANITFRKVE